MAKHTNNLFWEDGATIGVGLYTPWVPFPGVTAPSYADLGSLFQPKEACVLLATNNREVWSYAVFPSYSQECGKTYNKKSPYSFAPRGHAMLVLTKDRLLKPEVAHLLKWAKADIARRCKLKPGDPDALLPGVAYETKAPQIEDEELGAVPGMSAYPAFAKVAYRGVPGKVYSRTRADIHRLTVDALEAGAKAWGGWRPTGLEIQLHKSGNALGIAYAPGDGASSGRTKISLNVELFKHYDDNAIWRVLVHELCHHCHNEKYAYLPVPPEWQEAWKAHRQSKVAEKHDDDATFCQRLRRAAAALGNIDSHPPSFVFLLSKADPKVTLDAFGAGIWFVESVDTALVAELKSKAEEREARKMAKLAAVSFDPAKGRLVASTVGKIGRSKHTLAWTPLAKGDFAVVKFEYDEAPVEAAWEIVRTAFGQEPSSMTQRAALLSSVQITYDDSWRGLYGKRFTTLLDMLAYLVANPYAAYLSLDAKPKLKALMEGFQ
jgi:hypothetical protein